MNFISILGLLLLLGIAWALSYHKREINIRPIFWGIGLQLIFALIILREDHWSFIGMSILGLLIITFLHQTDDSKLGGGIRSAFIISVVSIVIGFLFYQLSFAIFYIIGLSLIYMFSNSYFKWHQKSQRYAGSLFLISGIIFLISNNLYGKLIFQEFSNKIAYFLSLSDYGAQFLFANLANNEHFFPGANAGWPGFGFQFAFKVLPTIVFFGGFMSVLYYLGIMQKAIIAMSRFMRWTIGTSGAETLSCSANIFVGQTEAP